VMDWLSNKGIDVVDGNAPLAEVDTLKGYPAELTDLDPAHSIENMAINDSVGLYLKEMSRVPLLTVQEEKLLAQQIETGWEAAKTLKTLSGRRRAQRRALEEKVNVGLQARDHLIRANTRLVVSIAKRYMGHSVPFLDLIQEGNLGLMKAVEKYDYHRGFRFSTYATWWIRQTISRSIADQGRTIRVPVHMVDRIRQMYRTIHQLEQKIGHPPSLEELAAALETPAEKVKWMVRVSWLPLSLESPIGDDENTELGAFVEDRDTPPPSQSTYRSMLRDKIEQVLSSLSPREALILRMRYGLDQGKPCTLEEVGQKFGLSRERIRQIEGKALRRLRHPSRARQLKDYL